MVTQCQVKLPQRVIVTQSQLYLKNNLVTVMNIVSELAIINLRNLNKQALHQPEKKAFLHVA